MEEKRGVVRGSSRGRETVQGDGGIAEGTVQGSVHICIYIFIYLYI
jgi:hypothetical protein